MKKRTQRQGEPLFQTVVNSRCPITGSVIDPSEMEEDHVRSFQGQSIGFCSIECLREWDDLSEQEREERLSDVREEQ